MKKRFLSVLVAVVLAVGISGVPVNASDEVVCLDCTCVVGIAPLSVLGPISCD